MDLEGIEVILLIFLLFLTPPLLGPYMKRVLFETDKPLPPFLDRSLGRVERAVYRLCHVSSSEEMTWTTYAKALLWLNFIGFVFLFLLQLTQHWLPWNPQHLNNVEWPLALNTAISFVTNTDWQAYAGETTLSYFTQMVGLTSQNFLSAATGFAVLLALIRGIKRTSTLNLGNFWVDLTRVTLYLFLPLSFIFALLLVSQGVIQNLHPYQEALTLEQEHQLLPMGPAASQVAIKQLGSNGGGFLNANSAHPFSNPTPFSNFLELFAILAIPAATPYFYGLSLRSKKEGLVLFGVMFLLWVLGLGVGLYAEWQPNLLLGYHPLLEGKETRIGLTNSVLWTSATTAVSSGSINAMLDSLSPLTGGIALFQILLGEMIFGGIGVGLCSLLMHLFLTVFLAGLMVGRTPEYRGKKIEKTEMQWVLLSILIPSALILLGSSLALSLPFALKSLGNRGPHGLTEILYAFASTANNNGSAFEGLNANTPFYNLLFAFVMLAGRLAILIPSLAVAGSLGKKKTLAPSLGTFRTDSLLFGFLLFSTLLLVAALTFFPPLSLGPLMEYLLLRQGQAF